MNDASRPTAGRGDVLPGPTVSFAFNLGKIPDHGEDSDPILRDGPDLGLIAVFDGMGGAGGTVYDTPEGRRTGAYLASRIARDVVEQRMLDLLEPDWNLNGQAAAEDLHTSVQQALRERLAELNAPPSGLRSRLLRALPTTMAVIALQRTRPGGSRWTCHVLWAGDSRAYAFEPQGARQLTTDDLRDPGDAMANLRHDSVVSNAISADTEFHVNYRKVALQAPFLVACATDGCFGYFTSPMHFEHRVLHRLQDARSPAAWSAALQGDIAEVTGDDAAMSLLGVGADFEELKTLYAPRVGQLQEQFITPLDELGAAVSTAEQQLQVLRQRREDQTAQVWSRYKSGYELYLTATPPTEDVHDQPRGWQPDGTPPSQAPVGDAPPEDAPPEQAAAEDPAREALPEGADTAGSSQADDAGGAR